jgi:hypothetical protein
MVFNAPRRLSGGLSDSGGSGVQRQFLHLHSQPTLHQHLFTVFLSQQHLYAMHPRRESNP